MFMIRDDNGMRLLDICKFLFFNSYSNMTNKCEIDYTILKFAKYTHSIHTRIHIGVKRLCNVHLVAQNARTVSGSF